MTSDPVHAPLTSFNARGAGAIDRQAFDAGSNAAPSTRSKYRLVLPQTTISRPVQTTMAGDPRSRGGNGSSRHASVAGSYAAPSLWPGRPSEKPPHTMTSDPVQTPRAPARVESGDGERSLHV